MAFNDLSEFIALLEKRGHLKRIKTRVDPELEITEITDRVSKGPLDKNVALLFENVVGSDFPVLINSLGHPQRMAWALGVDDLEELNRKLAALLDLKLPQGIGPALGRANDLLSALRAVGLKPDLVKKAPVQEQVYTGEIDRVSEPYKTNHARPALKKCLDLSTKYQYFDGFSRSCEVWLAKNYKAEYHVTDELSVLAGIHRGFVPVAPSA